MIALLLLITEDNDTLLVGVGDGTISIPIEHKPLVSEGTKLNITEVDGKVQAVFLNNDSSYDNKPRDAGRYLNSTNLSWHAKRMEQIRKSNVE